MRELSVFVDETGDQGGQSRYYAVTLVFHDQSDDIADEVRRYKRLLADRSLADVPFHASPMMNGHGDYENVDFAVQKDLFSSFFMFFQHLPVKYKTFLYRRSEVRRPGELASRIRRNIVMFLFDRLEYFQSFDRVKIYYDDAQRVVSQTLREAFGYALATDAVLYRKAQPQDYRLAQAADFACTMELAARKYACGEQTRTDGKFFGSADAFRRNYMKAVRRKRL